MMLKVILLCEFLSLALADPPKGAYIQKLAPLNPYDIKGDDIDKGGEVSKGFTICHILKTLFCIACPFECPPFRRPFSTLYFWCHFSPFSNICLQFMTLETIFSQSGFLKFYIFH